MQNVFPTKKNKPKLHSPLFITQALLAEQKATNWACTIFRYHGLHSTKDRPGLMIQIKS